MEEHRDLRLDRHATITVRPSLLRSFFYMSLLVAIAIIFAAFIELASRSWVPTFDDALIWLRTSDVGSVHTPLVGLYSRMGWDHPGPALFYALAPILRVLNLRPSALLVGNLLIAMLSTALSVVFVFRRAGFGAGLVLAGSLLILTHGLGDRLIDPWASYAGVLPFALFTVAIWLWSYGDRWMLPFGVAAGSFAVQCHIGVAATVLALAACAFGLRIGCGPRLMVAREKAPLLCSGALAMALWAPPLLQQLMNEQGNLGRILQYFFGSHNQDPALGWLMALRIAAGEFVPWGSWIGSHNFASPRMVDASSLGLLVLPLGLVTLAAVLGRYFRDHLMLRLVVIVAVGLLACVYSYAHIHGLPFGYLVDWSRVVIMFCVALPLMIFARRSAILITQAHQGSVMPTAAVILFVLAGQGVQAMVSEVPDPIASRIYVKFLPAIERATAPGEMIRVIAYGAPFTVSAEGLAVMLIRMGRDPRLQYWGPQGPGAHRMVDSSAVLRTLALVSSASVKAMGQRPNAQLLDSYDPLLPSDRMEAENLHEVLTQQFRDAQRQDLIPALDSGYDLLRLIAPAGVDQNLLRRFMSLTGGDQRRAYAVFLFPPTTW